MKNDSEPKSLESFFRTRVKEFRNECKDFIPLKRFIVRNTKWNMQAMEKLMLV